MDRRLRRGKHMPPPPPPRDEDTDGSESEASSEDAAMTEPVTRTRARKAKVVEDDEEEDEAEEEEEENEVSQSQGIEPMEVVDDEDEFPPPTPNGIQDELIEENMTPLELSDPSELGDMFEELIQKCDKLDKASARDENFLREMCKNIKRGKELFEYIERGTMDADDGPNSKHSIGGPGGMYLAYLHAKITSNLIRTRAEYIGSGNAIFTVDEYLESLRSYYLDEDGIYCHRVASGDIAAESCRQSHTLNPLVAVVGAFDGELIPVQKIKKPRAQRQKDVDEEQQETIIEDGGDSSSQNVHSNPVAENIAKDMNKVLKHVYRQQNRPVNLFEFTMDRSSFSKTIENIFYLSFLVKDGYVSLTKDENERLKDYSLNIKPEKAQSARSAPADDDDDSRNQIHRQKYILSFSPVQWKQFCAMSTGECTIAHFQEWLERQQGMDG